MLIYIVVCLFVIIALFLWHNTELKKFKVSYYKFANEKTGMNKTVRFVVLADLHNYIYGNDNDKLIEAIDEQKPDFVIIAGDMLIGKPEYNLQPAMSLVERLAKKYTVYYGLGNHEYRLKIYPEKYKDMYKKYYDFLIDKGVVLLDNESEELEINGGKIIITGLSIDREYYKRFTGITMSDDYIESVVGKKSDEYTILIAHNPEYFEKYAKWGAELTFSGHIHGGMVRLPYFGGVISPKIRLFPKYDSGLFELNGKKMIISRGLGTHTIPIRINNPAELIVVELK